MKTQITGGADLINSPEAAKKKFNDYATEVIIPHYKSHARKYHRADVVFDIYCQDSLTRARRKVGLPNH